MFLLRFGGGECGWLLPTVRDNGSGRRTHREDRKLGRLRCVKDQSCGSTVVGWEVVKIRQTL